MAASAGNRSWTRQKAEAPAHFILTGGQTRPTHDLKVETLLTATDPPKGPQLPEAEKAWALCRGQPSSVMEVAARLNVPVQIAKVLLSRLIDLGSLAFPDRALIQTLEDQRDYIAILEAVRDGLQRI